MIIGTAGHIDHGKTTLVRALTGVDTDRLKEEKARGISIELGYAYTPLPNGDVLGFIDVPGHEKLVHTMAAGSCGIDFALLVIAADDGVMPQTREHLAILQLLGVSAGAVALTKTDRVDAARIAEVRAEIGAWLAAASFADAPCFETQATRSDDAGVASLDAWLRARAMAWQARRDDGLFRLAVDRVFTLTGQGTVVTGTVFAGRVQTGDALLLAPAGLPVRVRSIHAQNRAAEAGRAGQRCALNLAGVDKEQIARGDWIVDARLGQSTTRLDAELRLLADADVTLRHWTPLHVHLGTMHRVANVVLLEGETVAPGECARVQLVFETPIGALPGDRFIVRDAQATHTTGGGRVLDPFAPARRRRTPERIAWLDALRTWLDEERIEPLLAQAPYGIARSALTQLSGYAANVLVLLADVVEIAPRERVDDGVVIARHHWEQMSARVAEALAQFHARMPDEQGPDAARLRRMTVPLASDAVWRAVVDSLVRDGRIVRSGPWLHLPSHTVRLDADEEALAALLRSLIAQGRYDPPWTRDLANETRQPEEYVRALLRKLARLGLLYQVVRDLFYDRDVMHDLARLVAQLARARDGAVEAAAFRDATGLGRKRAIQLLEFFDRVGYTRFQRERHLLRADSRLNDVL
ncbi:selenocysteine-specific translation elongation factor [Paraburkholderia sp.]|uniref:selenocysteine-specific translation elongation factor n=1 Tax=Paraburkholderia sp. TaxID=1926495 RepID=UPI0025F96025|nr:selenocysteine-specific translation elongation factor [Paraburkholderia sp.]